MDSWVEQLNNALVYIDDHLCDEIDFKEISRITACSIETLQRFFMLSTGTTLTGYIRQRRLYEAFNDLKNTDEKVIDIAVKYGYASPDAFGVAFKRMYGVTPSMARKDENLTVMPFSRMEFSLNITSNNWRFDMGQTRETKTVDQLMKELKSQGDYQCEIPRDFIVLDEYLLGITQPEFCSAFQALQGVVAEIYSFMQANPPKDVNCVNKLLYVTGALSALVSDSLAIRMDQFMDAYMTSNANDIKLAEYLDKFDKSKRDKFFKSNHVYFLFSALEKFGFSIEGLDKQYDDSALIKIKYPALLAVMNVIKAFSMPRICRASFGIDYAKFNYRVFSHASSAKLPLEDLHSYQLLSDEQKTFFSSLNRALEETGASFGECAGHSWWGDRETLPCLYEYKNGDRRVLNLYSWNKESQMFHFDRWTGYGVMPYVLMGWKDAWKEGENARAQKQIEFFKTLPGDWQKDVFWHCGDDCDKCHRRRTVITPDGEFPLCIDGAWRFPSIPKAVPYIIEAIET